MRSDPVDPVDNLIKSIGDLILFERTRSVQANALVNKLQGDLRTILETINDIRNQNSNTDQGNGSVQLPQTAPVQVSSTNLTSSSEEKARQPVQVSGTPFTSSSEEKARRPMQVSGTPFTSSSDANAPQEIHVGQQHLKSSSESRSSIRTSYPLLQPGTRRSNKESVKVGDRVVMLRRFTADKPDRRPYIGQTGVVQDVSDCYVWIQFVDGKTFKRSRDYVRKSNV